MVLVLVEGTNAFGVHDKHLVRRLLVVLGTDLKWLVPEPQAFGAWVYCRSHVEAGLVSCLIQENSVQ